MNKSSEHLSLQHVITEFEDCADFEHHSYLNQQIDLVYLTSQIDTANLYNYIVEPLESTPDEEISDLLYQTRFAETTDSKTLILEIAAGQAALFYQDKVYLVDIAGSNTRSVSESETETVIAGPHDAFTEDADVNLSLIRMRIKSSHLKVVKLSIGEVTKTDFYILYMKDLVNMTYVEKIKERISSIEIDSVFDTNMLLQYIDDQTYSIFPQFQTSERPDTIASKLVAGRVVGMLSGSPSLFSAPASFFEFFMSSDDYNQRWLLGSSIRLLRFLALIITLLFTALYVSVTTFHYEMIPEDLLLTLTESRNKVPFPPLYEALFLEITIELLREAGARLPTKIGQTIGIVGGIVIGQAAVQAGLTSNILIIAVASSAIASFVTPSYVMSASIRVLRFFLIILAGLWGNFGITVGFAAILIHMSSLTSLGSSYLTPVAPFEPKDWKDTFILTPYKFLIERPTQTKSPNKIRNKMKK